MKRVRQEASWAAKAVAGVAIAVTVVASDAAVASAGEHGGQPAIAAQPAAAQSAPSQAYGTDGPRSEPARFATPLATLRILVTGLASDRGRLHIAVCDGPASWSGKAPSFRGASVPVTDRRAELVFENVPFGDYAAKLYHDENGNDRFDMSLIGLPKEAYAFSNGARAYLGQPSFERAKFTVDSPVETVRIPFD